MSAEEPRLFDPDRYSPVSVAVYMRLPESSARAFAITSGLGRWLDRNGTPNTLKSGKDASGALVSRQRLPVVLAALAVDGEPLSTRQWRRYARAWEDEYVAHRCERGVVFLFARPLMNPCPACRQEIAYDHAISEGGSRSEQTDTATPAARLAQRPRHRRGGPCSRC